MTLEKASGNFRQKYLPNIKKLEESAITIKLNSILSTEDKTSLPLNFGDYDKRKLEQELYQGQSLFYAQMGLLRIVLSRSLVGDKCPTELKTLLEQIDEIIAEDPYEEYREKMGIVAKRERESQVKPPQWD